MNQNERERSRLPGRAMFRQEEGDRTHFMTLTFWKDRQAIAAFAGEPIERAKYYEEDKRFLLEFEPEVVHYEVFAAEKD